MAQIKVYSKEDEQKLSKFGARLKTIRELRGSTLEEYAEKFGCTKQRVSVWETGQIPSVRSLMAICRVYNTTPDVLLGYNENLENCISEFEAVKNKYKNLII